MDMLYPQFNLFGSSENAGGLVYKHIVPLAPIQLAKHEMTVKAVWGNLLFAGTARQRCSENTATHK